MRRWRRIHSWLSVWMWQEINSTPVCSLYQHSVITAWTARLWGRRVPVKITPIPSLPANWLRHPLLMESVDVLVVWAVAHRGGAIFTPSTVSCLTAVCAVAASPARPSPSTPAQVGMKWDRCKTIRLRASPICVAARRSGTHTCLNGKSWIWMVNVTTGVAAAINWGTFSNATLFSPLTFRI